MPNTSLQSYPYPAISDPANGPVAFQNLAQALENTTVYVRASNNMPPHLEGRVVYQTDLDRIVVSDGAAWQIVWFKSPYTLRVERVASQTLTANASTTISFDTEYEDVGFAFTPHATTGTTVTIPTAGLYEVIGYVAPNTGTAGTYHVMVAGTQSVVLARHNAPVNAPGVFGGMRWLRYNAGDTVQLQLFRSTTDAVSTWPGPSQYKTELQLRRVAA